MKTIKMTAIFNVNILSRILSAGGSRWPTNYKRFSKNNFRSAGSLIKAKSKILRFWHNILEENMDKFDGASRIYKKTTNILERPLNKGRNEVKIFSEHGKLSVKCIMFLDWTTYKEYILYNDTFLWIFKSVLKVFTPQFLVYETQIVN